VTVADLHEREVSGNRGFGFGGDGIGGRRMPEANAPPAAAQSIPVPVQAMHLRKPRRSQAIVAVIVNDEFFFGFHIFACFLC